MGNGCGHDPTRWSCVICEPPRTWLSVLTLAPFFCEEMSSNIAASALASSRSMTGTAASLAPPHPTLAASANSTVLQGILRPQCRRDPFLCRCCWVDRRIQVAGQRPRIAAAASSFADGFSYSLAPMFSRLRNSAIAATGSSRLKSLVRFSETRAGRPADVGFSTSPPAPLIPFGVGAFGVHKPRVYEVRRKADLPVGLDLEFTFVAAPNGIRSS